MDTKALIEHLDGAREALKQGESERGLSLVLDVHEAGHFSEELGEALGRMERGEIGARSRMIARLDDLIARAQLLKEDSEPSSLGMSLSDFFADVPSTDQAPAPSSPEEMPSDDDFEMIEIESDSSGSDNLDGHFSFADLGGELSFENLDLSFSSDSEALGDSMLDDIWPEDSMVIEDPSEPIELEEISSVPGSELGAIEIEQESGPVEFEDELDDLNAFELDEIASSPESDSEDEFDDLGSFELDEIDPQPSDDPAPLHSSDDDSPAFEASDAQTFDGFFDELDEQGQWFSTEQPAPELSAPAEPSEPHLDLVEVSQEELAVHVEPGGISGVSETQDGLDVFDIFNQGASRTDLEPIPSEPEAQEDPEEVTASSGLPRPPIVPEHHEPAPSPSLDFDLDFDDSVVEAPVDPMPPEPAQPEPPVEPPTMVAPEPMNHGSTPTVPQSDEDLFDDLFDFDIPEQEPVAAQAPDPAPAPSSGLRPPPTHVPESGPSLGFGDLSFGEEEERHPAPPVSADPPTRQMDVDLLGEHLSESSEAGSTQSGPPVLDEANNRETRTMPVVDRDLVNPFEQEEDDAFFDQPAQDEWNFDDDAGGMPGLDDDWLDAPANDSQLPIDPRDVHNDATAIPGLNPSNSGLPFNPYQNSGIPRTPSNPPESVEARNSSSLKKTQEGDSIPVKAMSRTLEHKETVNRAEEPSPSTLEHDYRTGHNPLEPEQEESDPFDFDLGLHSPDIEEVVAPTPPSSPRPEVRYDTSTEKSVSSTMFGIPFASAPEPERDAMPTPLPDPGKRSEKDISEDEFFALAESIAAEQSVASLETPSSVPDIRPYRGEPMMRGEPSRGRLSTVPLPSVNNPIEQPPNPFQQQTPTGVRQALVEESSQVSFALEEVEDDELDVGFVPTHLEEDQEVLQLERARKAYDRGHFEDALDMVTPLTSGPYAREANVLIGSIQSELERLQLERLGSLDKTPVIDMPLDQLSSFNIDHRAGFLLSQIDGFLTFEDILDLSAMSRLETILVLADLLDQKVIKTF